MFRYRNDAYIIAYDGYLYFILEQLNKPGQEPALLAMSSRDIETILEAFERGNTNASLCTTIATLQIPSARLYGLKFK